MLHKRPTCPDNQSVVDDESMPRHKRAPGEGTHVDSRRRGGSARTVSVRRQQFLDQKRERRRERLAGRALARAAAKPATGDEPGVDAPPRAPEPAVRLAEWLWRFGAEAEGVVPEPLPRLLFGGSSRGGAMAM